MDRKRTLRNVAIIVAIAAIVEFVLGGGQGHAANAVVAALWVGFGVAVGYFGLRMYREHRVWLYALGDRHRALLYVGVGLAVVAWAGRARMWQTSFGELCWFLIVGFIAYAAMEVYRHSRSY
jgi:hypothetical protein